MTPTKRRPTRTAPARPASGWTGVVAASVGVALFLVAGAVWSARVDARRDREHRAEMDRIVREGDRERERLFTREERDEIDRAVAESSRRANEAR